MKTVLDLLILIALEIEFSRDMAVRFTFSFDNHYQWLSMYQETKLPLGKEKKEAYFEHQHFDTEETLQLTYWKVFNEGRAKDICPNLKNRNIDVLKIAEILGISIQPKQIYMDSEA